MSISADGSVNGKNDGRKRTSSSSFSKKRRRKSVYTPFRSAKLMCSSIHKPFDLVEHRRVRRVGVDAVGAARRDHLDRRLVHARVAHLHRAGVRAQQQRQAVLVLQVDVERVLHRARRMVLRVVQRGEVVPVGLDLRAVGDSKPIERQISSMRCQVRITGCMPPRPRPRPGSVTSSASSARRSTRAWRSASSRAARFQRRLDLLLRGVELRAELPALLRRERA